MTSYFEIKNDESKKKYIKYQTLTTNLETFDTFVIIATTSSSTKLSVTGIELIALPISAAAACRLSIGKKVIYEIVMQKYNKYKELYQKDQQTIKIFDK